MLLAFTMTGISSLLLLVAGGALTIYGIVTKASPRGLSLAMAGLPVLAIGIGMMMIALSMPASP